jgi:hypothetical protein
MDSDVARILEEFANEIATLTDGSAPRTLIERTRAALRAALTFAAGRPAEERWSRFYREARSLVACVDDVAALPGLRAFLAENADLREEETELVRA